MKTYVWLSPEKLKFINDNPQVVSLLYDLGLLPEEISARVRAYVEEERERCAKIAENTKIIGGETPGPMYVAGWNGACEQAGKWIRDDSFPNTDQGGKP